MAISRTTTKSGSGMTSQRTRERLITRLRKQGIQDEVILSALLAVPRHLFLDDALSVRAYEDAALPIGYSQTISQPYVVAKMSELLRNGQKVNKVLEIGTGCGYQTAILSHIAKEVFSVERIRPLVMKARNHLRELKCTNVKLGHADGHIGLTEAAPFDGIIVTAGASHIPEDLLSQLAINGRMVIPVGADEQMLTLVERLSETKFQQTAIEAVKFVPLLGGKI